MLLWINLFEKKKMHLSLEKTDKVTHWLDPTSYGLLWGRTDHEQSNVLPFGQWKDLWNSQIHMQGNKRAEAPSGNVGHKGCWSQTLIWLGKPNPFKIDQMQNLLVVFIWFHCKTRKRQACSLLPKPQKKMNVAHLLLAGHQSLTGFEHMMLFRWPNSENFCGFVKESGFSNSFTCQNVGNGPTFPWHDRTP